MNTTPKLLELWSTAGPGYLPRRVVAHTFGYPASCWDPCDPDGEHGETAEKQYDNRVFRTEEEAIANARGNLHARIRHRARALQEARGIVEQATQECAQAAEEFAALLRYEDQRAEGVKS